METLNVIFPQLSASDWAVSLNLKDAFLLILVLPQSRRFLGFHFMDMIYLCEVLLFGLLDSLRVLTRVVTKPGVGVQGALGASSSDDPAMDPGSGIPSVLEEVFSGSAEAPFFSRVSAGRPGFGISPAVAWLPPSFG